MDKPSTSHGQQLQLLQTSEESFQNGSNIVDNGEVTDQQAQVQAQQRELEKIYCAADVRDLRVKKNQNYAYVTSQNSNLIEPGVILGFKYKLLPHNGVVVSVTSSASSSKSVSVIHYGNQGTIRVIQEQIEVKPDSKGFWFCLYPLQQCFPKQIVVSRAISRLNEAEHSNFTNRAKHFAEWCKLMSTDNRQNCTVPIFVSDNHYIHELVINDHLDVKCDESKVHGMITQIQASPDVHDVSVVTMSVRKEEVKNLRQVTVKNLVIKNDEQVSRVCNSQYKDINEETLKQRVKLIDGMSCRWKISEKMFVIAIINISYSNVILLNLFLRKSQISDLKENRIQAKDLKVGDAFKHKNKYGVVTQITDNDDNSLNVHCVQLCDMVQDTNSWLCDVKCLIHRKDTDATLRRHNEDQHDCELLGGGKDEPQDVAKKVTDAKNIHKGCAISFKQNLIYQHAVVMNEPELINNKLKVQLCYYMCDVAMKRSLLEIKKCYHELDLNNDDVRLIEYKVDDGRKLNEGKVVARASERIGERNFDCDFNNSRDFARWCSIQHPSNKEQCRVPVKSAEQLLQFNQGHVRFPRFKGLYDHHAILRKCEAVEHLPDLLKVTLYENTKEGYRTVRTQKLEFNEGQSIRRLTYNANDTSHLLQTVKDLNGKSFLDESLGREASSTVSSDSFCFWLRTQSHSSAAKGSVFTRRHWLKLLIDDRLTKKIRSQSLLDACEAKTEKVGSDSLKQFDHVIIKQKVKGKSDQDVHFVLTEWDEHSESWNAVTFEFGEEKEGWGVKEFDGYLRITGNGQVEKIVHNTEFNWELIDKKFKEMKLKKKEAYRFFTYNCEDFVNYLIYGRVCCYQRIEAINKASKLISHTVPKGIGQGVVASIEKLIFFLQSASDDILGQIFSSFGIAGGLVLSIIPLISHFLYSLRRYKQNRITKPQLMSTIKRLILVGGTNGVVLVVSVLGLISGGPLPFIVSLIAGYVLCETARRIPTLGICLFKP